MGDNTNKSVTLRQETCDNYLESLHYFHSFAVRDRTDLNNLEDNPCIPGLDAKNVAEVLPNAEK